MVDEHSITDPRILSILEGGESFKRTIDPDGLIREGFVREIRRSGIPFTEDAEWSARVNFASGISLLIFGGWNGSSIVLRSGKLIHGKESSIEIPFAPKSTLLEAIGELSRLPSGLKRILAVPGRINRNYGESSIEWNAKVFSNEWDSLFWRVEREGVSMEQMERFGSTVVRYVTEDSVFPSSAELAASCEADGCRITVSCCVDVYGLSSKAVSVDGDIVEGAHVHCECTMTTEDRQVVPSLNVAFQMAKVIEDSTNVKPRTKKMSMGKPKGMFKN